ncbi:MAG TPA: heavy-metal-associated domain-containing protein [Clostridiaceae bacterium]|nr:heavy-metal-associated domain-containing protein [Clostridiaceae bacterium]
MKTKIYQLETLTCPSCAAKIERAVKKIKGIEDVHVLFNASKVKATYDENLIDGSEIRNTIEGLGFEVLGEQ